MKRTLILVALIFSVTLSFAQGNQTKAEVFLQINNRGKYIVDLDDESVVSKTGRFRFYDVYNSEPLLTISIDNKIIFKRRINVHRDERLILDFSRGQLRTLNQLSLYKNQQYVLDDFFGYSNVNPTDGQPNYNDYKLMSPEVLQAFYDLYKKEAFDDGKTKLIKAQAKNSMFTTEQVKYLLKDFAFDDQRLEISKFLYRATVDPQNYTLIAGTFKFNSAKQDFLDFLAKQ